MSYSKGGRVWKIESHIVAYSRSLFDLCLVQLVQVCTGSKFLFDAPIPAALGRDILISMAMLDKFKSSIWDSNRGTEGMV